MYDNSRISAYTNVSARPFRAQCSNWSLDAATSEPVSSTLPSSFYFPYSQQHKQVLTPNYVNYYPPSPHYERPKSTILSNPILTNRSTFHVNDLRQRYEAKAVVGVVKPMVHQLSCTQLNSTNNELKLPDIPMINSFHHDSTRSLCSSAIPTPPPTLSSSTSSVVYRTRPTASHHNHTNGQPPVAPRRYSSISTNKRTSSHRSSRTTSTSSSIVGINELSSRISSQENEEQKDDNTIIVDVKRLEMFYGSVGTLVKAARCIARLYITTTRQLANFEDWSCQQLGIPVWIYNTVRILFTYLSNILDRLYFVYLGS